MAERVQVRRFADLQEGMVVWCTVCRHCSGEHRVTLRERRTAPTLAPGGYVRHQLIWIAEPTVHIVQGAAEAGFAVAEENVRRGTIYREVAGQA